MWFSDYFVGICLFAPVAVSELVNGEVSLGRFHDAPLSRPISFTIDTAKPYDFITQNLIQVSEWFNGTHFTAW